MLDYVNGIIVLLIFLSTAIQFAVGVLSYRITTKTILCKPAWVTITIAIMLMVIRRIGVSYEIISDLPNISFYFWPEAIGLLLSCLLFKGFLELDRCFMEEINNLTSLAEEMPAIVCIHNNDGYMRHFNNKWREYTGLSDKESYGFLWHNVIHKDDFPGFFEYFNMCMASDCLFEAKIRLRNKDGTYRWHFMRSMPIKNKKGNTTVWFAVISDIDDYVLKRNFFYGRD